MSEYCNNHCINQNNISQARQVHSAEAIANATNVCNVTNATNVNFANNVYGVDNGKLFLGKIIVVESITPVSSLPTADNANAGKYYIKIEADGTIGIYTVVSDTPATWFKVGACDSRLTILIDASNNYSLHCVVDNTINALTV